jgi:hypothetical protein
LNHYPELKDFLQQGDAESYRGVSIRYVAGRTAIMTIYRNAIEQEEIVLHTLKTKKDMHEMMTQKGFVLKSPEELNVHVRQEQLLRNRGETKERIIYSKQPLYSNSLQLFVCVGVGVVLIGGLGRVRRRRRLGGVV